MNESERPEGLTADVERACRAAAAKGRELAGPLGHVVPTWDEATDEQRAQFREVIAAALAAMPPVTAPEGCELAPKGTQEALRGAERALRGIRLSAVSWAEKGVKDGAVDWRSGLESIYREADKAQRAIPARVLLSAAPSAPAAQEGELVAALEWYANLPKEWKINAGGDRTYGNLHLLGEKARTALSRYRSQSPTGEEG